MLVARPHTANDTRIRSADHRHRHRSRPLHAVNTAESHADDRADKAGHAGVGEQGEPLCWCCACVLTTTSVLSSGAGADKGVHRVEERTCDRVFFCENACLTFLFRYRAVQLQNKRVTFLSGEGNPREVLCQLAADHVRAVLRT